MSQDACMDCGLWNGADGVGLRLHADSLDVLRMVSTNGAFRFDATLPVRASSAVTVAQSPAQHDCTRVASTKPPRSRGMPHFNPNSTFLPTFPRTIE